MGQQRYDVFGFGLMIAGVAIIMWMTIDGPPRLIKWQTLIAALVALVGGALAYRSAMAKVDFDREIRLRDEERRRVGVYTRLHYSLLVLQLYARRAQNACGNTVSMRIVEKRKLPVAVIRFRAGPELDEAWQHLELFPPRMAHAVTQLRNSVGELMKIFGEVAPDQEWNFEVGIPDTRPDLVREIHSEATLVVESIETLGPWLESQIKVEVAA